MSPSLIFNFYKRLRTTLSHRWSYSEYADDGATKDTTNRDGFGNNVSLANAWYFNDLRTQSTTVTYDYERNSSEGVDSIKDAHGIKLDFHSPLLEKIEGDLSLRYRNSNYPKFSAGPPRRRDILYSVTVNLSRPITSWLSISTAYSYERVDAKNNAYEYMKNVFTVQLTMRY